MKLHLFRGLPRVVFTLVMGSGFVHAADETQREALKRERETIEAAHAEREDTCRRQFVVTPCLEKARLDKQDALQAVRSQELALDQLHRRQRAEEQARRVAGKARAAELRDKPAAAPKEPARSEPPRARKLPPAKRASQQAERRSGEAQKKKEAFEARQREIKAHRKEVEKRNAERASRKPPIPLPVPGSAASP